jgi:hypothetical protein
MKSVRFVQFCAAALLPLLAVLTAPTAAPAADAVYLPGSRIGLVPLEGLTRSNSFRGFENADNGAKVAVAEVGADLFATSDKMFAIIDKSIKNGESLPPNEPTPERFATSSGRQSYLTHMNADSPMSARSPAGKKIERYWLVVSGEGFSGYIAIELPEAAAKTYPEQAIRTMLASVTIRGEVPVEEQLSTLPFKVTETAGFKSVRVIPPGTSVVLSDGAGDTGLGGPPYIIVSIAPIALGSSDERVRVARDLAQAIPGIKNVRFTSADPIRIAGTPGFEVRLEAKTVQDDKDITLVQWLRFGAGATLRMVAGATREDWPQAFPRFRAVRDGINPQN